MACEICGRSSCTRSFHTIEEQEAYDNIADDVKERSRERIIHAVNNLDADSYIEDKYLVDIDLVIQAIEDADLY